MENSLLNSFQQDMLYDTLVATATEESQFKLFSMLKPKIFMDGNRWCVLYGDNIQDGICGFGESPFKAVIDFTNNWYKTL